MSSVRFHYADVKPLSVTGKKKIKDWVLSICQAENKPVAALNYIFCSDDYLLDINKQFLQHDYYTDIITFDLSDEVSPGITGEIYISVDRVRDNAGTNKVSFEEELMRVVAHGALHLCGYGDKTKSEITNMRKKEDHYLLIFGA
jgi:probable rRNA maturation factor